MPHLDPSWILSLVENLASFSLKNGATKWHLFFSLDHHIACATHPLTLPQLSFFARWSDRMALFSNLELFVMQCPHQNLPINKVCALRCPPSQYMIFPHPNCSPNQESMCGVPPSQYIFFLWGVPPHKVVLDPVRSHPSTHLPPKFGRL